MKLRDYLESLQNAAKENAELLDLDVYTSDDELINAIEHSGDVSVALIDKEGLSDEFTYLNMIEEDSIQNYRKILMLV